VSIWVFGGILGLRCVVLGVNYYQGNVWGDKLFYLRTAVRDEGFVLRTAVRDEGFVLRTAVRDEGFEMGRGEGLLSRSPNN
jgi:hypothetical protein